MCIRDRELKLQGAGIKASPEKIREAINSMNFAKVKIDNKHYYIKTKGAELSKDVYKRQESHHRVMVLEVMGRYAGWIALWSGIAGGADVILIPEIPWSLEGIIKKIQQRRQEGKMFSVIVVAEGTPGPDGERVVRERIKGSGDPLRLGGVGQVVGNLVEQATGIETRVTVLGHIQRGGSPSPLDRILATRFGVAAAELAISGQSGLMVALKGDVYKRQR